MKNIIKLCFLTAIFTIAMTGCKKDVAVTGVTVSPTTVSLTPDATQQLTASVQPGNATNKTVTWSSGNTARATVSPDGMVSIPAAATAGEVTITVTTADGGKTANCTITVSVPVTGITIFGDATVEAGKTVTLTATVAPTNASNKNVTWSSLNTGIATVNAQTGVVTGVSEGTATIRATAADGSGVTADKSVTVTAVPPKTVTVGAQVGTLTAGTAGTVTFAVATANVANGQAGTITWYTTAAGTATTGAPTGLSASVSSVADNAATVTVNASISSVSGEQFFRVTFNGVQSNVATLTVLVKPETGSPWNIGHPNYNANVKATLEGNTLTISGTGNMVDFWNSTEGEAPWWFNTANRNAITTVVIESGVTNIGNRAFKDCGNLQTITIANSVTIIGRRAFDKCATLSSITIPSGVNEIEGEAFYDCSGLQTVTIANRSGELKFTDFYYSGGEYPSGYKYDWFYGCPIQKLHLGRNYLGDFISNIRTTLTDLTIGNTVSSIGGNAFANCNSLAKVIIQDGLDDLAFDNSGNSFANCPIQILHLGRNMIFGWGYATSPFRGITALSALIIGSNVTSIIANAFEGCTSLTDIIIPNKVTSVGSSAFYGCTELKSIIIGSGTKTIEGSTFYGCSKLTNITIPSTVTYVGINAFANCRSLINVRIEDGLDDLQFNYAGRSFTDCPIQTLHLGRNIVGDYQFSNDFFWGASPFQDKRELSSLTIGNNVTFIVAKVFSGCSGLTDIVIPKKVTYLGGNVFYGCTELKSVVIGSGIKTIEGSTFYGCSKLTNITIPSTVTYIGINAFANCRSLNNVRIEDGLDDLQFDYAGRSFTDCPIQTLHLGRNIIGDYQFGNDFFWGASPFQGKRDLSSLTIGNNVTFIVAKVFYDCNGITQITSHPTTPPTIQSNTFTGVGTGIPVYVPSGSITTYRGAPNWSLFTNYQGM